MTLEMADGREVEEERSKVGKAKAGEVSPAAKMTQGLCAEAAYVLQHSHYLQSSRML